jgi:catechol 2,3-dioxygenase-like lactoylglutathione lyase family enzyme
MADTSPSTCPSPDPAARARSPGSGGAPEGGFAALVPELAVTDLDASLRFWCGLLGFVITFDRPEARFAFLDRDRAQIMLYQRNGSWETGPLDYPFGRGINFQTKIEPLNPVLAALETAGWPVFEGPNDAWYRVGDAEHGQRECLVQDPDGYLVRLVEDLGIRAPDGA